MVLGHKICQNVAQCMEGPSRAALELGLGTYVQTKLTTFVHCSQDA